MSKPIINIHQRIWDDSNMNAVEHILNILPKYDYEFMDMFGNMTQDKRVICIADFLFRISKVLTSRYMIKTDATGMLYYKEGSYCIHYGFNRNDKKTQTISILIKDDDSRDNHPYISFGNTSFYIGLTVNMEEYNVIKTYILNKCIRNKEYMEKIFYRLYGISR